MSHSALQKLEVLKLWHGTETTAIEIALDRSYQMETRAIELEAKCRVVETPELAAHRDTLFLDGAHPKYYVWLVTAEVEEVLEQLEAGIELDFTAQKTCT